MSNEQILKKEFDRFIIEKHDYLSISTREEIFDFFTSQETHKGENWRKGYQTGVAERNAELVKKVEGLPNATRYECNIEKVICADEALAIIREEI